MISKNIFIFLVAAFGFSACATTSKPIEAYVEMTITVEGKAIDPHVVTQDIPPNIQEQMAERVKTFKFIPATKDGVPVESKKIIKVTLTP